jgi:seryl-tRNA synthetase
MNEITRVDQLPDWLRTRIKEPMWDKLMVQLEKDVQRNFDDYRLMLRSRATRGYRDDKLVQAYHDRALLAELEKLKMGRELNKAQQRIARQRKANKEMQKKIEDLEAKLEATTIALETAYRQINGDY